MKLYKDKMESYGRDPNNLKFMMTFTPVIGETESEANKKNEEFMKYPIIIKFAFIIFLGVLTEMFLKKRES